MIKIQRGTEGLLGKKQSKKPQQNPAWTEQRARRQVPECLFIRHCCLLQPPPLAAVKLQNRAARSGLIF